MKKLALLLFVVLLVGTLSACAELEELFPWTQSGSEETEETPPAQTPEEGTETTLPDRIGDHEIVYDLTRLNLIDHNLDNSDLLESHTLRTEAGRDSADVTIISDGELVYDEDGYIFNDAGAIELHYFARREETTAVEAVKWSIDRDKELGFFFPNSSLAVGPIRTNVDREMAALVVREEFPNGHTRVLIYLAQAVPGSNEFVVLDFVLYPELWETKHDQILAELSRHIGLNLSAYLEDGASEL